jgi:hypothetical protein
MNPFQQKIHFVHDIISDLESRDAIEINVDPKENIQYGQHSHKQASFMVKFETGRFQCADITVFSDTDTTVCLSPREGSGGYFIVEKFMFETEDEIEQKIYKWSNYQGG